MLDEIFTILDGLKNRPINYDDQLIRQIIERVKKLYYIAEQNLTEISYEVYVEDRTLYGYRIKYMDLFVLLAKKYNYTIKIDE